MNIRSNVFLLTESKSKSAMPKKRTVQSIDNNSGILILRGLREPFKSIFALAFGEQLQIYS